MAKYTLFVWTLDIKKTSRKFTLFLFVIRYLNTHYVRKRQTNDLDSAYPPFECPSDGCEIPPVEIGEVRYSMKKKIVLCIISNTLTILIAEII